jgi:hypothetical protein
MMDVLRLGAFHLSCLRDGVLANRFGQGERFVKVEFEKWMGEYDVSERTYAIHCRVPIAKIDG